MAQLVSYLLQRYLGDYVEGTLTSCQTYFTGFDPANIETQLLKGKATMKNLKLKSSVLEPLHLPFDLKEGVSATSVFNGEGFLGRIDLEVPITEYKTKSAVLRVGEIFILAGPSVSTKV